MNRRQGVLIVVTVYVNEVLDGSDVGLTCTTQHQEVKYGSQSRPLTSIMAHSIFEPRLTVLQDARVRTDSCIWPYSRAETCWRDFNLQMEIEQEYTITELLVKV